MDIQRAVDQLRSRAERLLHSPTEELGRDGRFLVYQVRLWWYCGRKLIEDRLEVTASALTYKTLLSLVPVLILFWLFVNAVVPEAEVRQGVRQAVFRVLNLQNVQVQSAPGDEAWDSEALGEQEGGDLAGALTGMIDNAVAGLQRGGAPITIISVVLFVWAGMSIFSTIEKAFNTVWAVRRGRSWFGRMRDLVTTLVVVAIVLGLAIWSARFAQVGTLVAAFSWVLPLAGSWLLFFVVYKTVPNVRVQNKAALAGALVAGTLWELGAKTGFLLYLQYATGAAKLYGNLALVPVFMLWIWLSWIIVLFGAELAYVVQYMRDLQQLELERHGYRRFLPSDVAALAVATEIGRRFADAVEAPTGQELSDAAALSISDVTELVDAFRAAGLIAVVERRDGARGYQPAKPPASVPAGRLLEVAATLELAPPEKGKRGRSLRWAHTFLEQLSSDRAAAMGKESWESLSRRAAGS